MNMKFQYHVDRKYLMLKTKSDNTIIVMCIQNTTDNDPVYYNYLVDLKSDNKVCITLDEVNKLKI